jgi:hypothetical protein
MLDRIAGNGVRSVIVESPDRFARDLAFSLPDMTTSRGRVGCALSLGFNAGPCDHTLTYQRQCSIENHAGLPIDAILAGHAGNGHR